MSSDDEVGVVFAQAHAAVAAVQTSLSGLESWPQGELLKWQDELFALRRAVDVASSRVVAETFRRCEDDDGLGLARGQGARSPEELVANASGGSTAEAGRQARMGKVLSDAERAQQRGASSGDDAGGGGAGADDAGFTFGEDDAGDGGPGGDSEPVGPVFPVLAAALREGRLSVEIGDVIGQALLRVAETLDESALSEFEAEVVGKAVGLSLRHVKKMIAFAEARVKPDDVEERERSAREGRFASVTSKPDGTWRLTAVLDAASAAPIKAFLDAFVRDSLHRQRDASTTGSGKLGGGRDSADAGGDGGGADSGGLGGAGGAEGAGAGEGFVRRTPGQMRADALVALARHGAGCEAGHAGVKTTVVVRLSLEDLRSGEGVAEVDGMDVPVSVTTARQLAADAEMIPCVLGGDGEILDWGRKRRFFTKAQALYLGERDGGCVKCHAPPDWCESHHVQWWSRGGPTDVANGVLLCTSCHHDLHRDGWQVELRDNRVWVTPPRHVDRTQTPRLGGRARIQAAVTGVAA
ncbi:HNH endonuclease signature motif containing protein [Demequina sp. NBRC 110054]|uniref:HNH endonuclease n=1 Tax=Demequina sp. NBRC 110054 TaxID=1570343 RepID=UPI000A00BF93|nr:HNH endonuclease signature motif containing protein [Demequina sp. NBRC 110054]